MQAYHYQHSCIYRQVSVGLQEMFFCLRRTLWVVVFMLSMTALHHCVALEPATPLSRLARQSWSVENGLPQNTISVLMQSRSGYMWIGTELGLARFDGNAFEVLDHSRYGSFPDAEIHCLIGRIADRAMERVFGLAPQMEWCLMRRAKRACLPRQTACPAVQSEHWSRRRMTAFGP